MSDHSPFTALLLLTALAVLVPLLLSRITTVRLPVVVGEILAGMIIGQSGFDLVGSDLCSAACPCCEGSCTYPT